MADQKNRGGKEQGHEKQPRSGRAAAGTPSLRV